jgi:prevent-host-death family protein
MRSTTAVSVRELEQQAPALVRRAARGERIVITRGGKPSAQLTPVHEPTAASPAPEHPRMAAWQTERSAFEDLLPRLEKRYRGRYVAIHGGRVVGSDPDPDALFGRIWRKLHGRTFFIGRIGGPPPIVDMPGFDVE